MACPTKHTAPGVHFQTHNGSIYTLSWSFSSSTWMFLQEQCSDVVLTWKPVALSWWLTPSCRLAGGSVGGQQRSPARRDRPRLAPEWPSLLFLHRVRERGQALPCRPGGAAMHRRPPQEEDYTTTPAEDTGKADSLPLWLSASRKIHSRQQESHINFP